MNALLINNLNSCNIHKTLYPRFINSPKGGKQISLIHFETDFSYNNPDDNQNLIYINFLVARLKIGDLCF